MQLAAKLASSGFHTLRFDYFGTGDSAGDTVEGDLEGWSADIETAIDEIRDIAATAQVTLIGLRLGALAAARVAARNARVVDTLVLWDPVASDTAGAAPMAEFEALLAGYPGRALMLSTTPASRRTPFGRSLDIRSPASMPRLAAEDIQPWTDRSANAGLVPMKTIQRILAWLG